MATINSVKPREYVSKVDQQRAEDRLSSTEKAQLHAEGFVPKTDWALFRLFMQDRSMAANPLLEPHMTAYSPGETAHLLNEPVIKRWHADIAQFKVPAKYTTIVFVPCAKTKPWDTAKRGLYKDYNKLRSEFPNCFFVTISEPLGIVPQTYWGNFPQYDNPGLFRNHAQRCGLFTSDFKKFFGYTQRLKTPFDEDIYQQCIQRLAIPIRKFLKNHAGRKMISFVEDFSGASTHGDMLTTAGFTGPRYFKREKPRSSPYEYLRKHILHHEK
jgi:hypothetical protein